MLSWSPEFETGVAVIDSDHQQLIRGLNALEHALSEGRGADSITGVLEFLHQYAVRHFAREEACMNRHKCPAASANQAAHQQFVEKFNAARERIARSPHAAAWIAMQTHRELTQWVVDHILRVDLQIRPCLERTSPEKAT